MLAWQMYASSIDTLDPTDVMQLLPKIDGKASESDLTELADTAILNAPELKKGEDTGFEFVHKSFAEYLVAEHLADLVERVTFQVQDYGSDEMTWRMSSQEAASQLAPAIGIRSITAEVQDMLMPMLGSLADFLKGSHVAELVKKPQRMGGLNRIVERFEALLEALLQGEAVDTVNLSTKNKPLVRSPFEAYANYCLGLIIIGSSAARQVGMSADGQSTFFQAEQTRGAFWRCLSILQAGGITIDKALGDRILPGLTVKNPNLKDNSVGDLTLPFKLGELARIDGYIQYLTDAVRDISKTEDAYYVLTSILIAAISRSKDQRSGIFDKDYMLKLYVPQSTANRAAERLNYAGMLADVSFARFRFDRIASSNFFREQDIVRICLDQYPGVRLALLQRRFKDFDREVLLHMDRILESCSFKYENEKILNKLDEEAEVSRFVNYSEGRIDENS